MAAERADDDRNERLVHRTGPPDDNTHSLGVADATPETIGASVPVDLPASFGRYRVVRPLGAGGMGAVYEATDPDLRRRVAVKLPHFAGPADKQEQARRRFLREARAAAAVEHPNVCPIYDVGEQDGRPFVVMGYVDGPSLADWLQRNPRPDSRTVAGLVARVAAGLAAVHRHGIVHRDLKPGNILLRAVDDEPILTDFGLAAAVHEDDGLTADGAILGTPAYMAPEQADPALGPVTPQSDLYSLGVVLFELVTGRRPFVGSRLQILSQVSSKAVPRASSIRDDIDRGLDAIIARATARAPGDRYTNAEDFATALTGWLAATSSTTTTATQATRRRPRWLVPASVTLAAILIGAGGYALSRGKKVDAPPPSVPPAIPPEFAGPLHGAIDVQVWRKGETDRPGMRLNNPAALPLAPGDYLRIEVELTRPTYAYIVWVDTEGKTTPLYPWADSDWHSRPNEERPVRRLSLPETDNAMAPLGGGPAGIETLLLLARDEPLPPDANVAGLFAGLPVQKAFDPRVAAWFENGSLVRNERDRGPIRLDQAKESDDPVLCTQSLLKTRLNSLFPYTRGVSFANRGD